MASERIAATADMGTMRGVSNPCGAGSWASSGHKGGRDQQPDSAAEDGEERPSMKNWVRILR